MSGQFVLTRGKPAVTNSGLRSSDLFPSNPHFTPDLADILPEKAELSEGDADHDHRQGPEQGNQQDIKDRKKPVLLNRQQVHDLFGNKAGQATANSKSAEYQGQLQTADLPFFL